MPRDGLLADPAVSRAKFEREIAAFRKLQAEYYQRGWVLIDAEFPTAFFILMAAHVRPAPVVFGVEFDFTDYDLVPLGVTLVDPFTREPYLAQELPTDLPRLVKDGGVPVTQAEAEALLAANGGEMPAQIPYSRGRLMVAHGPDKIPFVCLPGVREYHSHPGHTGDSWFLHRSRGTGRLAALLEHLHRFGARTVAGYRVAATLHPVEGGEPGQMQLQQMVVLGIDPQPE